MPERLPLPTFWTVTLEYESADEAADAAFLGGPVGTNRAVSNRLERSCRRFTASSGTSVVNSRGRHHELENLWITDGNGNRLARIAIT